MDRAALVTELLTFERPVPDVLASLAAYGWDCDVPLVVLKSSHIQRVLRRYIQAELSDVQVEEWANAIECRDDVAYNSDSVEGQVVFELANPALTVQLNTARAGELLRLLSVGA